MLDKQLAAKVLESGLAQGADFSELFVEKRNVNNIRILDGKVHEIQGGISFGIGIRLIYGTRVLYGYTNREDEAELLRIVKLLSAMDQREAVTSFQSFDAHPFEDIHQTQTGLEQLSNTDERVNYLMRIDKAARQCSDKLTQVSASALLKDQQVSIFNSEGLQVSDRRHYMRIAASAIAEDKGEQASGYEAPGALNGWEYHKEINPESLGEEVAEQAMTKLYADDCPAGQMPVVIDNGFGGVIFHEACGHLLETTSVAKKASVFHDKLNQEIANPCVSAVDDGTIGHAWGSINIDDEGMPTQKTQLIKDGVLTSFMVDKVGAMKTGYERTGSGRRESYKFAPASRMRNTYIEPGPHELEDIISSIDDGIYCKKMGGGSVQPGTGEFNFAANESYLIKKGKIDRPLKSATLIGTGPDILKKISMVSNQLKLAAGMCGSVSGSVPTTVGQGAIKVDSILVGGKVS